MGPPHWALEEPGWQMPFASQQPLGHVQAGAMMHSWFEQVVGVIKPRCGVSEHVSQV